MHPIISNHVNRHLQEKRIQRYQTQGECEPLASQKTPHVAHVDYRAKELQSWSKKKNARKIKVKLVDRPFQSIFLGM